MENEKYKSFKSGLILPSVREAYCTPQRSMELLIRRLADMLEGFHALSPHCLVRKAWAVSFSIKRASPRARASSIFALSSSIACLYHFYLYFCSERSGADTRSR